MANNNLYTCELVIYTILALIFISSLISKDEKNMDEYDRYSGIARDGKTRGIFGTIYDKEGKYDFSANFWDTNPLYN
jgi:hypothetical protein